MTDKWIPFGNRQESSSDELSGAGPVSRNLLVDSRGAVRRRPGLRHWNYPSTMRISEHPLNGVYETLDGQVFAFVGIQEHSLTGMWTTHVFKVNQSSKMQLGAGGSSRALQVYRNLDFAETEQLLVFADGNDLRRLELDTDRIYPIGAGVPGALNTPRATHVAHLSARLICNDTRFGNIVRYSGPTTSDTDFTPHQHWNTDFYSDAGVISAENQPDSVKALEASADSLYVFGATSLQLFAPDPLDVFAPAGTLELGIGAPYSIIRTGNKLCWIDNQRRVIRADAGGFEVMSDPIQRELNAAATVADAFGYSYSDRGVELLIWTLPRDGRTFVYQVGSGWGQWSTRGLLENTTDERSPVDGQFVVTSAFRRNLGPETLAGTTDGYLALFDSDAVTDLSDRIIARSETGFIDHETSALKSTDEVTLVVRRGETVVPGYSPTLLFGYRDRPGPWTTVIPVDLGVIGDVEAVVHLGQQGVYRSRQWFFQYDGMEQLALISATESVTVL